MDAVGAVAIAGGVVASHAASTTGLEYALTAIDELSYIIIWSSFLSIVFSLSKARSTLAGLGLATPREDRSGIAR